MPPPAGSIDPAGWHRTFTTNVRIHSMNPKNTSQVQSYAPEMKIFDLSPSGYSYDYAIKLFSTLGVCRI